MTVLLVPNSLDSGPACSPAVKMVRGSARAEDAQGTTTQSHISPSILVYEDKPYKQDAPRGQGAIPAGERTPNGGERAVGRRGAGGGCVAVKTHNLLIPPRPEPGRAPVARRNSCLEAKRTEGGARRWTGRRRLCGREAPRWGGYTSKCGQTLHPEPCTLHPAPWTPHPNPGTPHPEPRTLKRQPGTRNPEPLLLLYYSQA